MEIHFHGYKAKYDLLDKIFVPVRNSTPISTINIFVNIDDFFHMLHHPLINNEFQVIGQNGGKQMVSNVLNLLGHYKNWAVKRQDCEARMFGIYTSCLRSFKNQMYMPEYRKKFKSDNDPMNTVYYYINQILRDSMKIFQLIAEYLPGVYLLDSKYIEPSILPCYISDNVSKADWNILITRDVYDLQYAYRDKWTVIRPKGDNSTTLNRNNIWDYLNEKEKIYKDGVIYFRPELFPLCMSVTGNKYRSIPRLRRIGWRTLFSYLDKVKDEYDKYHISIIEQKFLEMLKSHHISDDDFYSNLYCIDVQLQSEMLMEIDKTLIESQIVDRYDEDALQKINRERFQLYPINLDFLCRERRKSSTTPFG